MRPGCSPIKHIYRDKQDSVLEVNGNIYTKMETGE